MALERLSRRRGVTSQTGDSRVYVRRGEGASRAGSLQMEKEGQCSQGAGEEPRAHVLGDSGQEHHHSHRRDYVGVGAAQLADVLGA